MLTSEVYSQPFFSSPRVFVSSTIHDLHDLRSGLKFWLEQMGAEVRMSEFTDFRRRPDQGALNSCFTAIEDCHYYVLLLGGRRGSWLDRSQQLTVTQQEYRIAMRLAGEGRTTPIVFMRRDVMTAVREWRARRRASGHAAPPAGRSRPTSFLQDPAFTDAFVREIEATSFGPPSATGVDDKLFYYEFTEFADLIPALRVNLHLHRSVRRQALLTNLRWELVENIASLSNKHRDGPLTLSDWIAPVRRRFAVSSDALRPLPSRRGPESAIGLPRRQGQDVVLFWRFGLVGERIRSTALEESIASGEFFEVQQPVGSLVGEPAYQAMQRLLARIDAFRRQCRSAREDLPRLPEVEAAVLERQETIYVFGYELVYLYGVQDTIEDILRLSAALLRYILDEQSDFIMPRLSPITPLEDQVERMQEEQATHEDVERWATDGYLGAGSPLIAIYRRTSGSLHSAAIRRCVNLSSKTSTGECRASRLSTKLESAAKAWNLPRSGYSLSWVAPHKSEQGMFVPGAMLR